MRSGHILHSSRDRHARGNGTGAGADAGDAGPGRTTLPLRRTAGGRLRGAARDIQPAGTWLTCANWLAGSAPSSHFDTLFPARTIRAPASPAPLSRAAREPDIRYSYASRSRTLDDYLDASHVTGLLVAQGNRTLVERYQYGRTDKHRLTSSSMAKTIIGLLIGVAVKEGAIRSGR